MDGNAHALRLTELAHGGGCGCKLAPAVLQQLLSGSPVVAAFPQLLVGTETADDAAVWQLPGGDCVIATTDFFMPVVDDPRDFGRIAATNAISDVYAMGGTPIFALAILGVPLGKLPLEMARASSVQLRLNAAAVPLLSRAFELCGKGFVTGASHRNWDSYGASVAWPNTLPLATRHLLTDAQTSGGLLVACDPGAASELLSRIQEDGYTRAAIVGDMEAGPSGLTVVSN